MISRISGKVIEKGVNSLILDTGNICYEVLIPQAVMQRLDENISGDGKVSLITFHYLQAEPSKTIPVLIGFLNEIEKDFFQIFITVSGIGPRAALKALNKPISQIARAIDEADTAFLKSLPGIGEQRAREVIAKLQNKVGRFGLVQDGEVQRQSEKAKDIAEEALAVLMRLEYKKPEASAMIKKALEISPEAQSTEELLNVVYKQKKSR
ncbi:MAG: Holliday junction branch migration protein RuvA [Candidatus Omnitrophota bacterium]|nr:Holliday junction branch migration protein RuvA [Candidatus Omnitrophota bacterium]